MNSLLLAAAAGVSASSVANAVVLADASSDTGSYVFTGAPYPDSPAISVSQYYGASSGMYASHFFFGLVEFDVSSLLVAGDKYLSMQASAYTDGSYGGTVSETGTQTVNVGIMPASFADYQSSGDRLTWFNDNILSLTPIGQMTFTDSGVTSLDVTAAVNDWISGSTSNYGFVFWKTDAGEVQLVSSDASSGYAPALTSNAIPEPETFGAIAGFLVFGLAVSRRRVFRNRAS